MKETKQFFQLNYNQILWKHEKKIMVRQLMKKSGQETQS